MVSVGHHGKASEFLAGTIERMLSDEAYFQSKLEHLDRLSQCYARPGATANAARLVAELVGGGQQQGLTDTRDAA